MIMNILRKIDAFMLRFVPPVVTDGIKNFPGFVIVAAVAMALLWGTLQRGLQSVGM